MKYTNLHQTPCTWPLDVILYRYNNYHYQSRPTTMLAVAHDHIQALYEGQPLLTQVGGFPPPGSGTDESGNEAEEANDASAG
jgi:hypothetical protein